MLIKAALVENLLLRATTRAVIEASTVVPTTRAQLPTTGTPITTRAYPLLGPGLLLLLLPHLLGNLELNRNW
jgi:hypothetical protein